MSSRDEKHPFAIGGKTYIAKRKRSQEEETERKRERQRTNIVSSEEELSEEEFEEMNEPNPF